MSVFRVITRIIPLTGSESSFEPVPFNVLTDGVSKDIKVLNFTEPNSGINYRIERIEDVQNVGPGETVESVNKAFAEKLKGIPGFVELNENEVQSNTYDKSFKFSLPQVVSRKKNAIENEDANSLTISLVKNTNYRKIPKSPKVSKKNSKDEVDDPKSTKNLCKSESSSYLKKKLNKESKLKNKRKKDKNTPSFEECNTESSFIDEPLNSPNTNNQMLSDAQDDKGLNTDQSSSYLKKELNKESKLKKKRKKSKNTQSLEECNTESSFIDKPLNSPDTSHQVLSDAPDDKCLNTDQSSSYFEKELNKESKLKKKRKKSKNTQNLEECNIKSSSVDEPCNSPSTSNQMLSDTQDEKCLNTDQSLKRKLNKESKLKNKRKKSKDAQNFEECNTESSFVDEPDNSPNTNNQMLSDAQDDEALNTDHFSSYVKRKLNKKSKLKDKRKKSKNTESLEECNTESSFVDEPYNSPNTSNQMLSDAQDEKCLNTDQSLNTNLNKESKLKNKRRKSKDSQSFEECNTESSFVDEPCISPNTNNQMLPDAQDDKGSNTDHSTVKNIEKEPCSENDSEIKEKVESNSAVDDNKVVSIDEPMLLDLDCGELVINEPEAMDSSSNSQPIDKLLTPQTTSGDGDDSNASNQTDSSQMMDGNAIENVSNFCNTFIVADEHPSYDLLQPLKKYFVSGECLICGFIPTDVDYNAAEHMESHISTNASFSYYKCVCCTEKFYSPRNLYMHALSRVKTYSYMCDVCFLKFKRKHYLVRHNAKAHSTTKQ